MSDGKRARLETVAPTDGAGDLAALLHRLVELLQSGGDKADGLDSLLDELGRLQVTLNGASEPAFKAIADAQEKLQVRRHRSAVCRHLLPAAATLAVWSESPCSCCLLHLFARPQVAVAALQAAVDRFTQPPGYRPPATADEASVRSLLSYAHRLSYSSCAPLGYQPGQPLYFFKPPAPQEVEMRASQLHAFARERGWERHCSSCAPGTRHLRLTRNAGPEQPLSLFWQLTGCLPSACSVLQGSGRSGSRRLMRSGRLPHAQLQPLPPCRSWLRRRHWQQQRRSHLQHPLVT